MPVRIRGGKMTRIDVLCDSVFDDADRALGTGEDDPLRVFEVRVVDRAVTDHLPVPAFVVGDELGSERVAAAVADAGADIDDETSHEAS
jgi:hypothetical protein